MNYFFEGSIHEIAETVNHTDTFKSRDLVCLEDGPYPNYPKFQFNNDRCDLLNNYRVGDEVRVHFELRGNKTKDGKYFTNIQAWKIERTSVVVGRSEPKKADKPDGWDAVSDNQDMPF